VSSDVWGEELPRAPTGSGVRTGWRAGPATSSWLVAAVVLFLIGIAARRFEVAVLGVPLLMGLAWTWARPPRWAAAARLRTVDQSAADGVLVADVECEPAPGVPLLELRIGAPGHRAVECVVTAERRAIAVEMRSVHTGRRKLFRIDHRAAVVDHLLVSPAVSEEPVTVTVLPGTRRLAELPLPFRLQGLTGQHGSRRAGDGGDLRDIAAFTPGDRLRRIDWRVTARMNTGGPTQAVDRHRPPITELYVRRTFATADATVMLVVDSRDDVGPRVDTWDDATARREDEATSLDLARLAAASIARHYIEAGDRVGLEDLGRFRRPFPPAGGRAQLHRLTQQLALASPEGEPTTRRRVPRLPSGSLIVVFSTFLDDVAAQLATSWRAAGHRVVAIDVLPNLVLAGLEFRPWLAYRIVAIERADRITALAGVGVETVAWQSLEPGHDPGVELGALARHRERR
jgi:uncharacterized protein (DUF58 family)